MLAQNGLRNFVCFHLGANWEPKRWPPGHFARLADLLAAKWDCGVRPSSLPWGLGNQRRGHQ
jgi:ADP-heptose:LPS heptosyltransferase